MRIPTPALMVTIATFCCASAQNISTQRWTMAVRVLHDSRLPFTNARVTIGFSLPTPLGENLRTDTVSGLTDSNGLFVAAHTDTGSISLGLQIEKEGYYPVRVTYDIAGSSSPDKWNISPTWTLKKVIRPVEMYAKRVEKGPPEFGKPIGYDLTEGDWVAPYGKGHYSDFIFTGELDQKSTRDFDYKLTVSFPNIGDGIQTFAVPATRFPGDGSALRSSQEAPSDGYEPTIVRTMSHHRGQPTNDDMNKPERNYYFRVRTVLDETGHVKSALYGKIYGDFMQFTYYVNPKSNDRNVEFDPKRNLFKYERVQAP